MHLDNCILYVRKKVVLHHENGYNGINNHIQKYQEEQIC